MASVSLSPGQMALAKEYESLQEKLKANQLVKQKLMAQVTENETVLKELEDLEPDAVLYKLCGEALVSQSRDDAVQLVSKRLEFIQEETARADKGREEIAEKLEGCAKQSKPKASVGFIVDLNRITVAYSHGVPVSV